MNQVSETIKELSPQQRELLLMRLSKLNKAENSKAETQARITRQPRNRDAFPLSFAQQRLWFLDQLQPGNSAYNISQAVHMSGPLDVPALEKTLNEIGSRHEALRTTFGIAQGEPVQVISPTFSLSLPVEDLQELPEDQREQEAQRLANEEVHTPFNLTTGPLIRAKLLRLDEQKHTLLLTMHHIITDGWSFGVLLQELKALYESFTAGKPSPLPQLDIQYADYAAWQREWLQGNVLDEQLSYWKKQLTGSLPVLELPADHARPAVQTYQGKTELFRLSPELTEALKALSQREGATLFMTVLAAFDVLLYRYSGQEDLTVGSPIANRNRSEIEGLVGCFINTLVFRSDLSGDPSFKQLLSRVREVAIGAYAHQDLPFERLVDELQLGRDLSHTPLFQVMFVLQNTPMPTLGLADLTVSSSVVYSNATKYDLSLQIEELGGQLRGEIEYNSDLFEADTIKRMAGHLQVLLEGIVTDPDQYIMDLPLLTEAEEHQIVVEWNSTEKDYGQPRPLHQLVEEQVERTPDAIALVFESEELTYQELNSRANQLAHRLGELGVGPETMVGICVERSIEMVVGLLGILKAGGAYVPLDPTYPRDRLAYMIQDAATPVLLTQEKLLESLPQHTAQVICLDADWNGIAGESTENPNSGVTAHNLAYMIYTSGSTGKPKGAMNTHKGIYNRLLWMQDEYQLTAEDRVLQKTPFSFDVSVWEFFWPLLTGARLVMARPEGHKDSAYLVQTIKEQKITTLHFVPSMLQIFVEEQGLEGCTSLKRVICSGEALPYNLQERFFARLEAELHNLYGPTEAAVDVTYWACERNSDRQIVPIGRPIANTEMYVLDAHLRPVPIGVAGELHIGGVNLGRGYHNRPELTAEKFIPDPFSSAECGVRSAELATPSRLTIPTRHSALRTPHLGARLYKTGDLARFAPDGSIEYLGRIDHQVKIRGNRIELGEIETVLGQHASVQEVVVVAREDTPGDKRLVAYLVNTQGQPATVSDLRDYLKDLVPEYMVPSEFVVLSALPLSPNGKVDRKALPAPEGDRPELRVEYVPPRTSIERNLATIWREVLHLDQVGVNDNFFDLGGHSLRMVQVNTKIKETLNRDVPMLEMFKYPTINSLAKYLGQQEDGQSPTQQNTGQLEQIKAGKSRLKQRLEQRSNNG